MTSVTNVPVVTLRPEKQGTFFARHPWVLTSSIAKVPGQLATGDTVDLALPDGRFIARGLYHESSRIRVRLYTWDRDTQLDERFWRERLEQAIELRTQMECVGPQRATRLVYSEGDGLSGLIVDQYGPYLVVQFTAAVMANRADFVLDWLTTRLNPRGIQVRIDARVAKAESLAPQQSWVRGTPSDGPVELDEYGIRLQLDLNESQKTGYYLDQRENRHQAAPYLRGRTVLDVCCYLGGFSLAASRAGAAEILALDTSARAIELARHHAQLNNCRNMEFVVGDCFEQLELYRQAGRKFGAIVLDPPRFAGSRRTLSPALQAYHRLNRLAMNLLEPGGILVSCSCSGLVTRDDFRFMLSGAALKARRDLQVLEQRGAAPDHPVRLACPETEYLKCFICRVQ